MRALLLLALVASACSHEGASPLDETPARDSPTVSGVATSVYGEPELAFTLSERHDGHLDLGLSIQFSGIIDEAKVWISSCEPFATDEVRREGGEETLLWQGSWFNSREEVLPVVVSSFTLTYPLGEEAETSELVMWTVRLELISPAGSASTPAQFYLYRDGERIISGQDGMVVRQAQLEAALRARGLEGASMEEIGREAPELARQLEYPMQPPVE